MIPLSYTQCSNTNEFLLRALGVAEFYGFVPFDELPKSRAARFPRISPNSLNFVRKDERALVPLVHNCARRNLAALPSSLFWRNSLKREGAGTASIELHVIGIQGAMAEALLITIANAIAKDAGVQNVVTGINSIGSADSSARYVRELSVYLRKHADSLPDNLLSRAVEDPVGTMVHLAEKGHPIAERAPQSTEFLNEEERQHLRLLLEFLEANDIFYELNPFVLGSRDCWTHTLFEMRAVDPDTQNLISFVYGGRYDSLVSMCPSAGIFAAGMSIVYERRGTGPLKTNRQIPERQLYLAHLGIEAKRKSIRVLEILRQSQIPVYHSLTHDLMADQITEAKRLNVPFILVIGHKEALENTALVRDTRTNAQWAIPIPELPGYLRRRRLGA